MYQLMRFGLKEMTQCGAALRRLGVDASSFQDVAAQIVHFLYTQLVDEAGHLSGIAPFCRRETRA
jgi:hypothetical protein